MSGLVGRDLSVSLKGRRVLAGVDFAVAPGELVAVIGPNGAGKTTLLRTLAGLIAPEAGDVLLGGAAIARTPPRTRARRLAFLPQENEIHWPLSVRDVVLLGRLPYRLRGPGGPGPEDRAAADAAIRAHGLADLAERPATELSGGERRRVLLARALVGAPAVLLADEPTASLDPGCALDVMGALRHAASAGGAAVMATHDLGLAARFADRLVLLDRGDVIADGPADQVLTEGNLTRCYGVRRTTSTGFELGPVERVDDRGDVAGD